MYHYHLAGYDFYISDSLRPIIDPEREQFFILHPIHHSICFSVKLVNGERLRLDSFFGLRHEMKENTIYIYEHTYDGGDEIDEAAETLPV